MEHKDDEVVIPIVAEELHADAVPVETGGVRVTKHVEGHDEVLEQELRKGRVQIKRVKTHRIVDGPQAVQHAGNTLIVPIVSEVLRIEKQWVVTEEIHLTQIEERETVQQKVRVNQESAKVERVDQSGEVVERVDPAVEPAAAAVPLRRTLAGRTPGISTVADKPSSPSKPRSILRTKSVNTKPDR